MQSKLLFIYDGECPFCNYFAELLELKSNIPGIEIKNAREYPSQLPVGYDMDIKGAILLKDGSPLTGASAINYICSKIENPSDSLLNLLSLIFSSHQRTRFIFPLLLVSRRIALFFKGVPRKVL
tara:strand:+ start:231 stop:602 length:372 start_codon:yes stop_codon:yes gene_type:complete